MHKILIALLAVAFISCNSPKEEYKYPEIVSQEVIGKPTKEYNKLHQ